MSTFTETLIRAWFIAMFSTILVGPFMAVAQENHALSFIVEGLFLTFFVGDIILGVVMMVMVFVDTEKTIKKSRSTMMTLDARR